MTTNLGSKHLVLIGAGRAHMHVLSHFAKNGAANLNITLISDSPNYIDFELIHYWVDSYLEDNDVSISLESYTKSMGAQFYQKMPVSLDPVNKRLELSSGQIIPYDYLSINMQPAQANLQMPTDIEGAIEHALFVYPLFQFMHLWPQAKLLASKRPLQIALIAKDCPPIETVKWAMSIASALKSNQGVRLTVVAGHEYIFNNIPAPLQKKVKERFKELGIGILQLNCLSIKENELILENNSKLACDAPIFLSNKTIPKWLENAKLNQSPQEENEENPINAVNVDINSYVKMVNDKLQNNNYRDIFITPFNSCGDTCQVLEKNLQTAISGGSFSKVDKSKEEEINEINLGGGKAAKMHFGLFAYKSSGAWEKTAIKLVKELNELGQK